ncbi:MAG: glycosyltransferase family 2 protein [Leptospiraceae bacterium]|nr:glycosyltransferase family 2 protein [Leptospiraceae bacterium]
MIRKYFYKLLYKYLSVFVRENDLILAIDPEEDSLISKFQNTEVIFRRLDSREIPGVKIVTEKTASKSPDYILLNGNIHYERDIQMFLNELRSICGEGTRLIITYYSSLWKPWLKLATFLRLRRKTSESNWITKEDLANLLLLSDYEIIRDDPRVLFPIYFPLLSNLINRYLSPTPMFRQFCLSHIMVSRPRMIESKKTKPSVSVVVAARNEEGNIENILKRLPKMGPDDELILVEGNSTDNTWQKIQEIAEKYKKTHNIQIAQQDGKGKGDAVRKGFGMAKKDILMILDADLTVPPEDLPRFYEAISSGKGEFINGSRLVYPMEKEAMRFFNLIGNKFFAMAFSFVLGQRFKDTLCGTKVLTRENYLKIEKHRSYFGEFDPFGDFDLIFGASRLNLKIVEVPIIYRERTYGETNISRWKHGVILLAMLIFAARKIKFI